MTDSIVATGLTVEQWDDKFFTEYLTENRYAGEMGTNENAIIQVKENLMKKPGDRINFALVNKLTNDAITGRSVLEGNEEDMASPLVRGRDHQAPQRRPHRRGRRAVLGDHLRDAASQTLKDWALKDTEKLIEQALASINGVDAGLGVRSRSATPGSPTTPTASTSRPAMPAPTTPPAGTSSTPPPTSSPPRIFRR